MISPSKVCSNIHGFVTNLMVAEVEVWIAKVDLELSVPHKKLDSTSYQWVLQDCQDAETGLALSFAVGALDLVRNDLWAEYPRK